MQAELRLISEPARPARAVPAALAAAALALAALGAGGCYYLHVAAGQARILFGRESIEDALAREDGLGERERAALALVPEIRRFAVERLGLADAGAYRTFYDTGGGPVAWAVSGAERTSFTPVLWSFPFVGDAPYKGFFDRDAALEEARRLTERGYDAYVRGVAAYSTLGWFEDPVFGGMLGGGPGDLANAIIHEMAHATVFRPGDAEFNEGLATFAGDEGAAEFLAWRFGADSPEAREARDAAHDERLFVDFVEALYRRLDRLYRGPGSTEEKLLRREEIFEAARAELAALRRARFRTERFAGFERLRLNNAAILVFRTYHADAGTFADVLDLCGRDWRRAIDVWRRAAREPRPLAWLADWRVAARDARRVRPGRRYP